MKLFEFHLMILITMGPFLCKKDTDFKIGFKSQQQKETKAKL